MPKYHDGATVIVVFREFIPPLPGGHRNADGNGKESLLSSLKDGTVSTSEEPKMEPTSQDPAWRARRGHDDQEGGHGGDGGAGAGGGGGDGRADGKAEWLDPPHP